MLFSVARLKGLEPLTHCLEGSCSIHLSYKRKYSRISAEYRKATTVSFNLQQLLLNNA